MAVFAALFHTTPRYSSARASSLGMCALSLCLPFYYFMAWLVRRNICSLPLQNAAAFSACKIWRACFHLSRHYNMPAARALRCLNSMSHLKLITCSTRARSLCLYFRILTAHMPALVMAFLCCRPLRQLMEDSSVSWDWKDLVV